MSTNRKSTAIECFFLFFFPSWSWLSTVQDLEWLKLVKKVISLAALSGPRSQSLGIGIVFYPSQCFVAKAQSSSGVSPLLLKDQSSSITSETKDYFSQLTYSYNQLIRCGSLIIMYSHDLCVQQL